MAALEPLEPKLDIAPLFAAVAQPGDTVLVGFDRTLSDDELEDLREGFKEFTETTGVHIGFVEHVTSMVVMRPEATAELMDGSKVTLGDRPGCVKDGVRYNCPTDCGRCEGASGGTV